MTTLKFQFEKATNTIPIFVISYKRDRDYPESSEVEVSEMNYCEVITVDIAAAFKILEHYNNNMAAVVWSGCYDNPASICWYPEHDSDHRAIISSGSSIRSGVYVTDEQVDQLINELREYVRYCVTIV